MKTITQDISRKGAKAQSGGTEEPLTERMLTALRRLEKEFVPHDCGGFTTDDMQWCMGTAFISDVELHDALDDLTERKLIRYAGYDEEDAIGHCYALRLCAFA